jgi:hypothetical protein
MIAKTSSATSPTPPLSAVRTDALFSVFRVQDKDGRGPFKPGFSSTWVEDRDDHDNLVPWFVEMGRVDLQMIAGMSGGTACRTLDQLRRWFTPSEYKTLRRHGYQAVRLEAGRIIGESGIQLFFERCRPLKEGAIPVELYPENAATDEPQSGVVQ